MGEKYLFYVHPTGRGIAGHDSPSTIERLLAVARLSVADVTTSSASSRGSERLCFPSTLDGNPFLGLNVCAWVRQCDVFYVLMKCMLL